MPSLHVTWAIVLFWLGTMGWFAYTEYGPILNSTPPRSYTFDLDDEIGGNLLNWKVYSAGKPIGLGTSIVKHVGDGNFELTTELHFDDFRLFGNFEVHSLSSSYEVTTENRLVHAETKVSIGQKSSDRSLDSVLEIKADVRDGQIFPKLSVLGLEKELPPTRVNAEGTILNPMHLVNRFPGLHAGQQWSIPLLDPVRGYSPVPDLHVPVLIAKVKDDILSWNQEPVRCRKIEYFDNGEIVAATWVRRSDNLVLQQDASYQGRDLQIVRDLQVKTP